MIFDEQYDLHFIGISDQFTLVCYGSEERELVALFGGVSGELRYKSLIYMSLNSEC